MSAPKEKDGSASRLPQLDVLRAVAILLVLGSHQAVKADNAGPFVPLAVAWGQVGFSGVDLFFVLSGFLIGGLLFAELRATGTLDVRRFLVRRAFKIWPSYYIYLLVMIVVLLREGKSPLYLVPFFVNLQNYLCDELGAAGHTWSLAVEEHFYLALPILLYFVCGRFSLRSALVFFLLLAAVCATLRGFDAKDPPAVMSHLRIDSLAFGVLLSYCYHFHREWFDRIARHRVALFTVGVIVVALVTLEEVRYHPWLGRAFMTTALFLAYGGILMALMAMPPWIFQNRLLRLLALIGFFSYPIYLWHIDAGYLLVHRVVIMDELQAVPGWLLWPVGMAVYFLMAIGAGVLMSRCVELPTLAIRDRLFPSRSRAVDSQPALEPAPVSVAAVAAEALPVLATPTPGWHAAPATVSPSPAEATRGEID